MTGKHRVERREWDRHKTGIELAAVQLRYLSLATSCELQTTRLSALTKDILFMNGKDTVDR